MSLDPVSIPDSTMPSEVFFKKQAGRVQKALSNFQLVSSLPDASTLIRAAMTELVDVTVRPFIFLPSLFILIYISGCFQWFLKSHQPSFISRAPDLCSSYAGRLSHQKSKIRCSQKLPQDRRSRCSNPGFCRSHPDTC